MFYKLHHYVRHPLNKDNNVIVYMCISLNFYIQLQFSMYSLIYTLILHINTIFYQCIIVTDLESRTLLIQTLT